jgi:hypothetical protein
MRGSKFFVSEATYAGPFAHEADCSNDAIKNEPMFFNSSVEFAFNNGGPITRSFLNAAMRQYHTPEQKMVFDSRVHMLMPGWYPAIPGFHHDDVPRPPIPVGQHFITAGQPDYDTPRYLSKHIMGLVNAETAPTEFALGSCEMPEVPEGELIYRTWHEEVKKNLASGKLRSVMAPDRMLIKFDWQTFHQGTKCVKNGWRWFGRLSWNTDRANQTTDEIRRNAQVYLEFPMEGW